MADKEIKRKERITTGIAGFDKATKGGIIRGSINLITGGPGTGKTIFASHFLWEGIVKYDENVLFISLEEEVDALRKDLSSTGMDFEKMHNEGKCHFVYFGPYSSSDLQAKLTREITRVNAKRVVIDSISVFAMALKNDYEIRKEIYLLTNLLKKLDCTVIMTSEIVGQVPLDISTGGSLSRYGVEEFVCDSVITVHNSGLGGPVDRALRIVKMRRTNHVKGPVPMKITDHGMEVNLPKNAKF